MRTAVWLVFLLLLSLKSFSQTLVWEKLIDFLPNQDVIYSIDQDSDTTFVFCGTNGFNSFFSRYKLDDDTLWKQNKNVTTCYGNELIASRDGKLFHFGSNNIQSCSKINFLFQELDQQNGTLLSSWDYGDSDIKNTLESYAFLPDGGFLASGLRESTYYGYLSLMKLNSSGNMLWYKKYRDLTIETGIMVNRKGNYLLKASSGDGISAPIAFHSYFLEVSPDGDSINSKYMIIQADSVDEIMDWRGMVQNEDGDYVFGLRIDSVNMKGGTVLERYAAVVMMDTLFNIKWKLYLHKGEGGIFYPSNIVELKDSTYILAVVNTQPESNQFYFYKISKTGQILDQKIFSSSLCNKIFIRAIKPLNDGSLLISHACNDGQNAYLAKIDTVGLPMVISATALPKELQTEWSVQAYPNPFSKQINFKIIDTPGRSYILTLYNSVGQQTAAYKVSSKEHTIERNSLASGLYFYKLVNEKGEVKTGKIVAE
jgi:hypothetical protein